jgi:hypothetical protein
MLKQKVKLSTTGEDANIFIDFSSEYKFGGLEEDIEKLIEEETNISINSTADGEKTRFMPSASVSLSVNFYRNSTASYVTNVAPNEFTSADIKSSQFLNSFFTYSVFDTTNENVQEQLHTGYLNGANFNGINSVYTWSSKFEYPDIHIPNSFLAAQTTSTFSAYMKLNFYSGKSGKVYPFSKANPLTTSPFSEVNIYNKLTFDLTTKKYTVTSPFSFYEITNPSYVNVINQSVESVAVEKPTYPTGNTFTLDGKYINVG